MTVGSVTVNTGLIDWLMAVRHWHWGLNNKMLSF